MGLRCSEMQIFVWCVGTAVWYVCICNVCASEIALYMWFVIVGCEGVCIYKCGAYAQLCAFCVWLCMYVACELFIVCRCRCMDACIYFSSYVCGGMCVCYLRYVGVRLCACVYLVFA